MRRSPVFVLSAALVVAACSSGDDEAISDISLVPITEPADVCGEEDLGLTSMPATNVPETTEVAGTEPTEATEAAETTEATDTTETTGATDAIETTEATETSQPSGFRRVTGSADMTEPAGTTEPTDTTEAEPSETTDADADQFDETPEIDLPDELPTELEVTVLEEGDGDEATDGDLVEVYYVGVLSEDGTEFDSNYGLGSPFRVELGAGRVIQGWDEGLVGARPGDRLQLDIPGDLAYGEAGSPPNIPPDAALTFVIDVVDVVAVPEPDLPDEPPDEVQTTTVIEGPADGPEAALGDIASVFYVAVSQDDGAQLDANYSLPDPSPVLLGDGVVFGDLDEHLVGARPGDRVQLDVPAEQAAELPMQFQEGAVSYLIDIVDITEVPQPELPDEVPTDLERTVIDEGPSDGREVGPYDLVDIYYVGVLTEDGTRFQSNFGEATPMQVVIADGQPTEGLTEGLMGARPGDRIQLDVPSDLAYGQFGNEELGVGSGAALTYVVDVVDVAGPPSFELPEETPEELATTVLEEGAADGRVSQRFDTVVANLLLVVAEDGTAVANTWAPDAATGQPASPFPFTIGQPTGIDGLDQSLLGRRPGDVVQVDVPAEQAFGETGSPDGLVPPDAAVTIVIAVDDVTGPPLFDVPEEIPTELTVTELEEGTGEPAEVGDMLLVDYTGVLSEDGTRVATNYQLEPFQVVLGDEASIPGWEEGLEGATTGSQLLLDIPADLAFGSDGVPSESIPPDSALSFMIDVLAVIPATTEEEAPTDLELPLRDAPATEVIVDDVEEGDGAELGEFTTGYADVYAVCAGSGNVVGNSWGEDLRVQLPMSSGQGGLMEGLHEGLLGMKAGGRRIVTVPAPLALGSAGGLELDVGPNHDLIFVVDLYAVVS